jgi:exodeoxyribonuclease VII large subunit
MEHQRQDALSDRLAKAGRRYLEIQRLNLKSLTRELIFKSPAEKLKRNRSDLAVSTGALPLALSRYLINERRELASLSSRLKLVSPLGVLSRGYALATNARGEIVRSSSAVSEGDCLDIRLAQGRITAQVVNTS